LLRIIKDVYLETKPPEHSVPSQLQGPGPHSMRFDLDESYPTLWKKYDSVRHSAAAWADEFGRDTSRCLNCPDKFLFDLFFFHWNLPKMLVFSGFPPVSSRLRVAMYASFPYTRAHTQACIVCLLWSKY